MARIGVFDSGVGGLTVLKELAQHFPAENFLYLGDTARLPYGQKSPETIRKYSEQILNFLKNKNVDAIVIACNSASSQVSEKSWLGIPVYNVIEPGADLAVRKSSSQRIGVLGTRATIVSNIYRQQILKLSPSAQVFSQACPLFVPLAEEGWVDDPVTNLIVYRYLQPLLAQEIDTLILGCTHYPLLRTAIQKVMGPHIQLIDSGNAMAETLRGDFSRGVLQASLQASSLPSGQIEFLAIDLSQHTETWAHRILSPLSFAQMNWIDLQT